MRRARKPVTLLRVFLEPVRAAFWVQPYQRVPVRVWSLFAVGRAPALSAPSAGLAAPVEVAIRSRARSRFLVGGLYVGRAIGKTAISLARTTRTTRSTRV